MEIAFYLKACAKDAVAAFKESRNLLHLGVPSPEASGSYWINGKRFRFLVLPRYGMDLQSVIDSGSGKTFSAKTSCSMAIQVVSQVYGTALSLEAIRFDPNIGNMVKSLARFCSS